MGPRWGNWAKGVGYDYEAFKLGYMGPRTVGLERRLGIWNQGQNEDYPFGPNIIIIF